MAIRRSTVTITTVGANGSATGTGITKAIDGEITAIYIDYTSQPVTTDVTIVEKDQSPAVAVLSVSNTGTDAWYYPMHPAHKSTDGTAFTDIGLPIKVADQLLITVSQGDSAQTVAVTVIWDDRQ